MTQPTWLNALAEDLRGAGYACDLRRGDHYLVIDKIFLVERTGKIAPPMSGIYVEHWSILDIVRRHLTAAGLAPAPESDGDLTIPFVPSAEYTTDAVDCGTVEPVFALGCDFDEAEEGAGDGN